jgi:hypothetical protein
MGKLTHHKFQKSTILNGNKLPGVVVYTCNLSNSGGRDGGLQFKASLGKKLSTNKSIIVRHTCHPRFGSKPTFLQSQQDSI